MSGRKMGSHELLVLRIVAYGGYVVGAVGAAWALGGVKGSLLIVLLAAIPSGLLMRMHMDQAADERYQEINRPTERSDSLPPLRMPG